LQSETETAKKAKNLAFSQEMELFLSSIRSEYTRETYSIYFKKISKIKPYYVIPERYAPTAKRQETEGMSDIIPLPEYEIEIPSQKLVRCMSFIDNEKSGEITKKRLRDLALQHELIRVEGEKDEKSKELSAYMSLNKNLIQPLLIWNFIEVKKRAGAHRIKLTVEGKNALKFLGKNK